MFKRFCRPRSGRPTTSHVLATAIGVTALAILLAPLSEPRVLSQSDVIHAAVEPWSIGYWNSTGDPAAPLAGIDFSALTHITHWAALVQADGSLDLDHHHLAADAPALVPRAHEAGVKALFGIVNPYWLGHKQNIQQAVVEHRAEFVANIMKVVDHYGYDGVDIDWEGSPVNVAALAADLRAALGPSRILTADAVILDHKYWSTVHSYFDRINVMTYDMAGVWTPFSWHNSALFDNGGPVWSVERAVKRYVDGGTPREKINIGIPFYGYRWTGGISAPNQFFFFAPTLKQMKYNKVAALIDRQSYQWDSQSRTPFLTLPGDLFNGAEFISYDDEKSVAAKVNYVKDQRLGGWIIWNLSTDYMPDSLGEKHPLLKAVKDAREAKPAVAP
jgi:chitinase